MILTGKCKEDFEKWYENNQDWYYQYLEFKHLHASIQYGIYVDFFDKINYKVYVAYNEVAHKWNWHIDFNPVKDDLNGYTEFSLSEARTKAIEKANEIYNEKI